MNDRIENTILNSLFFNEVFKKPIPFISSHSFQKRREILFDSDKFIQKYNNLPQKKLS